jgi:hypothetical protein
VDLQAVGGRVEVQCGLRERLHRAGREQPPHQPGMGGLRRHVVLLVEQQHGDGVTVRGG